MEKVTKGEFEHFLCAGEQPGIEYKECAKGTFPYDYIYVSSQGKPMGMRKKINNVNCYFVNFKELTIEQIQLIKPKNIYEITIENEKNKLDKVELLVSFLDYLEHETETKLSNDFAVLVRNFLKFEKNN